MSSDLAAGVSRPRSLLDRLLAQRESDQFGPGLIVRLAERAERSLDRPPRALGVSSIVLLGLAAAGGVAYVTAQNPAASPAHAAATVRVVPIVSLIAAGIFVQTRQLQPRMGALLISAGLFSALWLLNGARNETLFSIGVACSGAMPLVFAHLMLAHPTGHVSSGAERRFLALTGGTLALLLLLGVALTRHPMHPTVLLGCDASCPSDAFALGSGTSAGLAVDAATVLVWLALTVGTPVFLWRRMQSRPAPIRRSVAPVLTVAAAAAALLVCYLISVNTALGPTSALGMLYVGLGVAIPLGVLLGLSRERLFMAHALAEFVSELARTPRAEPRSLMAAALRDPSLRIAYRRPGQGTYVDPTGALVLAVPGDQAVTWIERDQCPVAAVMYDPELTDYDGFVHAAGAAALLRLESIQLEADLKASTADLVASRVRVMDIATAERRRLERDLHDGIQQHLVGLRIRLAMAAEAVQGDPAYAEQLLTAIGTQMDTALDELRSLARGIYPSLLSQCGLIEAIRGAARKSTIPVEVRARRVVRYGEEVELALYFSCLEALQNVAKHAGPDATATVMLRQDGPTLSFEVRDCGVGFSSKVAHTGSGMSNMRDRVEAVGGRLEIRSGRGRGTLVRGSVRVS